MCSFIEAPTPTPGMQDQAFWRRKNEVCVRVKRSLVGVIPSPSSALSLPRWFQRLIFSHLSSQETLPAPGQHPKSPGTEPLCDQHPAQPIPKSYGSRSLDVNTGLAADVTLYKLDNLTRPQLLLLENGIRCLGKFNSLVCAWHTPNTRELLTATIINCYSSPST